jgi:hypothetical protein
MVCLGQAGSELIFGGDAPGPIGLVIQNLAEVAVAEGDSPVSIDDVGRINRPPITGAPD